MHGLVPIFPAIGSRVRVHVQDGRPTHNITVKATVVAHRADSIAPRITVETDDPCVWGWGPEKKVLHVMHWSAVPEPS